jgi:hypothetical protein
MRRSEDAGSRRVVHSITRPLHSKGMLFVFGNELLSDYHREHGLVRSPGIQHDH